MSNQNDCDKKYYGIGTVLKSNQGCEYVIVGRVLNVVRIKFLDEHAYEYNVSISNICTGNVRNPYAITQNGKGYYGIIEGLNVHKREKKRWSDMLKTKLDYPPTWNCLEFFVKDLRAMNIENYEEWLKDETKKLKLVSIVDGNYIIGFEVTEQATNSKRVEIECVYNGEKRVFGSILEASIETGYCMDTIRKYCTLCMVVDGFKYRFI